MFDKKYVYVNKQEYQASVKQVSGFLQLGELKVTAENPETLSNKLDAGLSAVFEVLNEYNKELEKEKNNKELEKEKTKKKTKKDKP